MAPSVQAERQHLHGATVTTHQGTTSHYVGEPNVTTTQQHYSTSYPASTVHTESHHGARFVSSGVHHSEASNHHLQQQYHAGAGRVIETRVVGVERGVERLISTTEHQAGERIINERVTHQTTRVPKKVVREEIVEKTIIVPEVIQIEEWIDAEVEIEDRVVEIAKVIQVEKVVEVPEIEIIEKIIEVPEYVIREKIREVPRIETVERFVEVPVIQTVEKIVEVPQIEYRDVPIEKIVEVPEVVTEEVPREVAVPQYVERPIEQVQVVHDTYTVERKIPVPVEAETIVEYALPHIRPRYAKKKFPVYLPRFVEVPIAKQFADAGMLSAAEAYSARVANLTHVKPAVALSEIELLATEVKDADLVNRHSMVIGHRTIKELYAHAWETGNFEYFGNVSHYGVTTGVTIDGNRHHK